MWTPLQVRLTQRLPCWSRVVNLVATVIAGCDHGTGVCAYTFPLLLSFLPLLASPVWPHLLEAHLHRLCYRLPWVGGPWLGSRVASFRVVSGTSPFRVACADGHPLAGSRLCQVAVSTRPRPWGDAEPLGPGPTLAAPPFSDPAPRFSPGRC